MVQDVGFRGNYGWVFCAEGVQPGVHGWFSVAGFGSMVVYFRV